LYAAAVVVGGEMSFKRDAFSTSPKCTVIVWCGKSWRGHGVANRIENAERVLPVSMSVSVRATKPPNEVTVVTIEPQESTGHEMNPMLIYWRVVWSRALILEARDVGG
jgi:hypothetical protein